MEVIQYPNSPFKLHQPFPPAGDQPLPLPACSKGFQTALLIKPCSA